MASDGGNCDSEYDDKYNRNKRTQQQNTSILFS